MEQLTFVVPELELLGLIFYDSRYEEICYVFYVGTLIIPVESGWQM